MARRRGGGSVLDVVHRRTTPRPWLGAIAALHNTEGIADVGIYASPGTWNSIVGNYQPSVPYWMADWLSPPSGPATCAAVPGWQAKEQLPTGPVEIVQYGDNVNGADGDYAC